MTRPARIIHTCCAGPVLFLAAASTALAQPAASGPAPLTPGAIVLLASDQRPAATETLRRALGSDDPDVRRAAARVAGVAHAEVLDALRRALESEQDAGVVAEFVKDVMALQGAKAESFVDPYARKAGATAVTEIAE